MKKQKSNNLLSQLLSVLTNLLELTKKYGKANLNYVLFFAFASILLWGLYKNTDRIVNGYISQQEQRHEAGLQKRHEVSYVIQPMLEALRLRLDADRVMLLEFHNGGKNSSGLEFEHFSAMYEAIDLEDETVELVKDQYKNQDTGAYIDMIEKLRREGYIYSANIAQDYNSKLIRNMKRNGVQSYWIYGMFNPDGRPKALLTITSDQVNGIDEAKVNRLAPDVIHKISSLITGINN